jgi:hypothetical protein
MCGFATLPTANNAAITHGLGIDHAQFTGVSAVIGKHLERLIVKVTTGKNYGRQSRGFR